MSDKLIDSTWNHTEQENSYYLKNRKTYSSVSVREIEAIFEKRMKGLMKKDLTRNGVKGTYTDWQVQARWEEFYNGFRLGEDSVT